MITAPQPLPVLPQMVQANNEGKIINNNLSLGISIYNLFTFYLEILEVCVICFNGIADVAIIPCGHRFCNDCTYRLQYNEYDTCPLCGGQINNNII